MDIVACSVGFGLSMRTCSTVGLTVVRVMMSNCSAEACVDMQSQKPNVAKTAVTKSKRMFALHTIGALM